MARRPKPRQPLTDGQWRLVVDNLSMTGNFASRWFGRGDRHFMDAETMCLEGLMRAAQTYDPGKEVPFRQYAYQWVRVYLFRYRERLRRDRLGVFSELPDGGSDLEEHPCRFPGPVRQAIARELMEVCRRVLDARLWKILYRRHILGEEQQAIAVDLGVNRSRVSQLERQAIERVRQQLPHLVGAI